MISIGSFCALTASLLGSLFPMPRIIYAMSSDGLLFHFLAHVFPPTGTPLIATVIAGVFASVLALIVSLRDLIGNLIPPRGQTEKCRILSKILGYLSKNIMCLKVLIVGEKSEFWPKMDILVEYCEFWPKT